MTSWTSSIKTSLNSLPTDILFDILTLFDNLQDLHAVTSITRSLNQAFQDQRAAVLQHVFRNQILKHHADYLAKPGPAKCHGRPPSTPLCTSTPLTILESIEPIMARYEKTKSPDRLLLRSTAWATFTGLKSPEWVFTSLGQKLISCCRAVGRGDLALSYAAELWTYISTRQTFDYHIARNRLASDRYATSFARSLAKTYYHDFKRPEDAANTILQCYDMRMRDHDYQLFSNIQTYTQEMTDPAEVLIFFRRRADTERRALADGSHKGELHWVFCFTLLLSGLGKVEDAVCVFNDTYVLYPNSTLDPVTLEGLSRRLIRSLIKQGHHDEAFVVYQQILTLFSPMHMVTPSKYLAWANQYTSDLNTAGRSEESLAVDEQVWNRLRQHLNSRKELSLIRPAGNAAYSLYFRYKKHGRFEEARSVISDYRALAKESQPPDSHVYGPGYMISGSLGIISMR